MIKTRIKHKRDTAANWTAENTILLNGEIAIVDDGNSTKLKIGDGSTAYNSLPFYVSEADLNNATGVIPVANGGTNATTAEEACANIGALPLSGGEMSGHIAFSQKKTTLYNYSTDGQFILRGGSSAKINNSDTFGYDDGASLYLCGKDEETAGGFKLVANNGTNDVVLYGRADGTLTWAGRTISNPITGASISGKVITLTKADGTTTKLTTQDTVYTGTVSQKHNSTFNAAATKSITGLTANKPVYICVKNNGTIAISYHIKSGVVASSGLTAYNGFPNGVTAKEVGFGVVIPTGTSISIAFYVNSTTSQSVTLTVYQ